MFYGMSEELAPNFEVLCFDEFNNCINKEYFERLDEAREFAEAEQTKLDYEWVSVTPMNDAAYDELCNNARGTILPCVCASGCSIFARRKA